MEPVVRFIRTGVERAADAVLPIGVGAVLRTLSLPAVFSANQLRISEPARFEDLLELAEQHLEDLPFRHIVVEHEPTGARLEQPFKTAGWAVERDLLMVLRRPPDRDADTSAVIEIDEEQMLQMMIRWHLDEHPDAPSEVLGQLAEYGRRESRAVAELRLAIADGNGSPAAIAKFRSDGSVGHVEDVYTLPEARGRGHARALVSHAVALARSARHDPIFIVADDRGWPQQLYRQIGFEPVGRMWNFHRAVR